MAIYILAKNVRAAQSAAQIGNPNLVVSPVDPTNGAPMDAHAFTITVTGAGDVSATCQPIGSNDGVNFVNYGATFTGAGPVTGSAAQLGNTPFAFVGAIVTAISGTNAAAEVRLSA